MKQFTFQHKEKHGVQSKLLGSIREIVFGLEDSLVSTIGVVAGIAAGTGDQKIVILSGTVLVVVEALSMAAGSFLSSQSHHRLLLKKIREEELEIEEKPQEERDELRQMYKLRGFSDQEVDMIVSRITKNKKVWLQEMIEKELGIHLPDEETPLLAGVVMGIAYILGGLVPISPFLFFPTSTALIISFVATVIGLFILGVWSASVTGDKKLRNGVEMMLISTGAAILGYGIGKLVGMLFGI